MSIQSMYRKLPPFIVPSKLAKAPVSQGENPAPQNLQRSGGLKFTNPTLEYLPLLTEDVLRELYPVSKIPNRRKAYLTYFIDHFCDKKNPFYTPLFTWWGDEIDPIAHRNNSARQAFEHITSQKPEDQAPYFCETRASYLPLIKEALSTKETKWHKNPIRGNLSAKSMVGILNVEGVPFTVVLDAPRPKESKPAILVTAYPAKEPPNTRVIKDPPIFWHG